MFGWKGRRRMDLEEWKDGKGGEGRIKRMEKLGKEVLMGRISCLMGRISCFDYYFNNITNYPPEKHKEWRFMPIFFILRLYKEKGSLWVQSEEVFSELVKLDWSLHVIQRLSNRIWLQRRQFRVYIKELKLIINL